LGEGNCREGDDHPALALTLTLSQRERGNVGRETTTPPWPSP